MNVRLTSLALLVAGCSGAIGTNGGDDQNLGSIAGVPQGMSISIDSIEPAVPVEGRRVVAHFSLDNWGPSQRTGRVGAVVAPVGSAPFTAPLSWRVDQLGIVGETHGVVVFDAPPASHGNHLTLFFEDGTTRQHVAQDDQAFDVAARWDFELERATVDNPRALQTDTDWIGLASLDGHGNLAFADARFLGNGGGGHTFVGPYLFNHTSVDAVPDVDTLTFATLIVNQGRSTPRPGELESIAAQFAQGTLPETDLSRLGWWDALIYFWPLFDCDGVVVADRRPLTGRQLIDEGSFFQTSFHAHGYNSPGGCGAVSNYEVTLGAVRRDRSQDPDVVVSPAVISLRNGAHTRFTVDRSPGVDWTVEGGAVNGFIDVSGLYTMVSTVPANTLVRVRATARDGSGRSGVAYVSLDPTPNPRFTGVLPR